MRGIVIVCAVVFVMGLTSAVKTGYWRNSVLIVPAERVIDFSLPYLPATIAEMRAKKSFEDNAGQPFVGPALNF